MSNSHDRDVDGCGYIVLLAVLSGGAFLLLYGIYRVIHSLRQTPEGRRTLFIIGALLFLGLVLLFIVGESSCHSAAACNSSVQLIGEPSLPEVQIQSSGLVECPNAPMRRLQVGMTARVTYTDGTPNILRSGPGKTFGRIASMLEGTQMKVIGGPDCASGYWYWQVQTSRFGTGWTAEGDANSYWLEPMPDQR